MDPLGGTASVQSEVLLSIVERARSVYDISVFAPYCSPEKAEILRRAGVELLIPQNLNFAINRLLARIGKRNESMLWAEAWLREATFRWNRMDALRTLDGRSFDRVVNMSMTVSYPSDLWWIQGMPLDETLHGMAPTNLAAQLADLLARPLIRWMDRGLAQGIRVISARNVTNSPFLRELYVSRGIPIEGVVLSLKDFARFRPAARPSRDYVLTYVGKESEPLDYGALKSAGVRIVGFGGKVPATTDLRGLTGGVDFRGFVSNEELVRLYSNAKFTLFPFTCEPLGFVPLESMACGTPVLTFGRQGPATTVLDGATGWLVGSPKQMVERAIELWNGGANAIRPESCIARVQEFTVQRSVEELIDWIERRAGTETSRSSVPSRSPIRPRLPVANH